jgi:hypothetical protein
MINLEQLYLAAQKFSIEANQKQYKQLHSVIIPELLSLYMDAKGKCKLSGNWSIKKLQTNNAQVIETMGSSKIFLRKNVYVIDYGFEGLQFITFDLDVAKDKLAKAYNYGKRGW